MTEHSIGPGAPNRTAEGIRSSGGAATRWIALALVAGLLLGIAASGINDRWRGSTISAASLIGGLWLDALRMTVIPLLFALLFKGVVAGSRALSGGRLAARTLGWFLGLYFLSAVLGALLTSLLLVTMPLPPEAVDALRSALGRVDTQAIEQSVATTNDYLRSFIPPNPFKAAADGSMLQLMVFGMVFALAAAKVGRESSDQLLNLFDAIGQAMLIVVGWLLVIAPVGVFALSFALGAGTGVSALGAVVHYFVVYCLVGVAILIICYLVAVFVARFQLRTFAKTLLPVQSFALSTQSSTASLPLMVNAATELGVTEVTRDIVLPMAVSLFRVTGPAMNIAVCIYIAHWLGINLGPGAIMTGVLVATFATISAPGLPGQISFVTSIGPIAIAMGLPLAPLGIFIALEPIPDMLRTVCNVTMDVAVTGAVDRTAGEYSGKKGD